MTEGSAMLASQDNEALTQVGANTPGGRLLRYYWLPFLLSVELPDPDCPPLRVRLLGEDLIAFRVTSGAVGLVANACPHRGASMFFGRNEEEGLRCVYHGWKFDTDGACVDMPSEPMESNFKAKVRARAYPCRERNGVVWAYLGDDAPPPLPELEWNTVPAGQSYVSKRVQLCNWFQALEGGIDSSHTNFIHAPLDRSPESRERAKHLTFFTVPTESGVIVANRRDPSELRTRGGEPPDARYTDYWRANHYLMPFYTLFPPNLSLPDSIYSGHAWVPIDDESTLVFHWSYNAVRPLTEKERSGMLHAREGIDGFHLSLESMAPSTSQPFGAWYPRQNAANDYLIDYEAQATVRFSGIPGGWNQDAAVQETMGAVSDRLREHLGTSDIGIIAARRYFIAAARSLAVNAAPPASIQRPTAWKVRPVAMLLEREQDWLASVEEAMKPEIAAPRAGIASER